MGWRPDFQDEIQNAEKPEVRRYGCWVHHEARLEVLPAEDGALLDRTVPTLDKEPSSRSVLVVAVSGADERPTVQGVPEKEGSAENPMAEVWNECGRWKSGRKIRDLLADGRCGLVVLDFLSSTDVGSLVPTEDHVGSDVSQWEPRERREWEAERRAEELGAQEERGAGEDHRCSCPPPLSCHRQKRVADRSRFLLLFLLFFPS